MSGKKVGAHPMSVEINEVNDACSKFIPDHKIPADLMLCNPPFRSFWKSELLVLEGSDSEE